MRYLIIFFILCNLFCSAGEPSISVGYDTSKVKHLAESHEPVWSAWIATQMGYKPVNVCEVKTYDGSRVDILTPDLAIEVEWSNKWKESIGQAVLYGIQTRREPGIIILSRGDDLKYIHRCQIVCTKLGIQMRVQKIPTED